jgi:hypothetical protein
LVQGSTKPKGGRRKKNNCFECKNVVPFFSFLFLSLYLLILQKKQFWVKFFVLNKKNKHNKKKTNKQTKVEKKITFKEIQPVLIDENLATTSRAVLQRCRTGGIGGEGAKPRSFIHQRPQPTSGAVREGVGPTPALDQGSTKTKGGRRQEKFFGMKNRFFFIFYVVLYFLSLHILSITKKIEISYKKKRNRSLIKI